MISIPNFSSRLRMLQMATSTILMSDAGSVVRDKRNMQRFPADVVVLQ